MSRAVDVEESRVTIYAERKKREPVRFKQMDGAGGTSRCAVATKLNTPLMNALIWLPACGTSGGTAGYQELIQTKCNPSCCI
ncbi:hypothetical protein PBY51_005023 [Eleginops maclovinus]|uniref:Uncharacterized protein n=1 Tax=Eleginops maclovinus TaxID=56733 RepID=A0AAN7X2A1_ELEMC|nr:hypothetical protein PBY51_005023 [Eleginops maclovinus]